MIYAALSDGTRRALDKATVKLTWLEPGPDGEEVEREFDLSDVEKFVLLEPQLHVKKAMMPTRQGRMPIVGVAFRDPSDVAFEVPFPASYLLDVAAGLKKEAEEALVVAERTNAIQSRIDTEVPRAAEQAAGLLGGVVLDEDALRQLREKREREERNPGPESGSNGGAA